MNIRSNPDKTIPAVTTGPLAASKKIFANPDAAPELKVPLREIMLSEGAGEPNVVVYDTSGPYTDPDVTIDVNAGLPRNPQSRGVRPVRQHQRDLGRIRRIVRRLDQRRHVGAAAGNENGDALAVHRITQDRVPHRRRRAARHLRAPLGQG